ncbi:MAG: methionine adenosyltransferase [Candidatus Helarchaeota archaeon]
MTNIEVIKYNFTPIEKQGIEIVERKGKGHPDTICDEAVENLSRKLSQYYLDHYGIILHHNVDKCSLAGGRSEPVFAKEDKNGGEIITPIYICIIGRATADILKEGKLDRIPIDVLTREAVLETVKESVRNLNTDLHLQIDSKIFSGSGDLVTLFGHKDKIPLANDTSFGVGFAPFSETENLVFKVEKFLNAAKTHQRIPAIGEDIKVMGLRNGDKINLTCAIAMVAKECDDVDAYMNIKDEIRNEILDLAVKSTKYEVACVVNQADIPEKGSVYITVTGTSAESGDDGQVGRGNRVNGLITPCRPMSLEATAGKNPVNHVGKLYNVLANKIADKIVCNVNGVSEAYLRILSQIGSPISEPLMAYASLLTEEGTAWNVAKDEAQTIIDEELKNITDLTEMFLKRKLTVC